MTHPTSAEPIPAEPPASFPEANSSPCRSCTPAADQHDPKVWSVLADLYGRCPGTSGHLDWCLAHEDAVPDDLRVDVLNAISAVQQRLYRSPDFDT